MISTLYLKYIHINRSFVSDDTDHFSVRVFVRWWLRESPTWVPFGF